MSYLELLPQELGSLYLDRLRGRDFVEACQANRRLCPVEYVIYRLYRDFYLRDLSEEEQAYFGDPNKFETQRFKLYARADNAKKKVVEKALSLGVDPLNVYIFMVITTNDPKYHDDTLYRALNEFSPNTQLQLIRSLYFTPREQKYTVTRYLYIHTLKDLITSAIQTAPHPMSRLFLQVFIEHGLDDWDEYAGNILNQVTKPLPEYDRNKVSIILLIRQLITLITGRDDYDKMLSEINKTMSPDEDDSIIRRVSAWRPPNVRDRHRQLTKEEFLREAHEVLNG
jgi:hypothetical protein